MDIDKKLKELLKKKKILEDNAVNCQNIINTEQSKLVQINKDWLIIVGKIEAYNEIVDSLKTIVKNEQSSDSVG